MKFAVPARSDLRVDAYRFPPWAVILIALLALWLQGYLPLWFPTASVLYLPLLVTLYFALSRRSQISGMLVGAAIGLAQDSLGHGPIGLFGMVKTDRWARGPDYLVPRAHRSVWDGENRCGLRRILAQYPD